MLNMYLYVWLALFQYVDPWPIILIELSKYEKNRLSTLSKENFTSCNAQFRFIQYTMTDVMANLFVDVHPFRAELTWLHDCNSIWIESTISEYFLRLILLCVLVAGKADSLRNTVYDLLGSGLRIVFPGNCGKTDTRLISQFPVSRWN